MPLLYLCHESVHRLCGFVLLLPCGVGVGAQREARGRLLHRDSLFDHQLVAVGCGDTDVWLCVNIVPATQPCGDGIFICTADIDSFGSFRCGTELRLAFRLRLTENIFDDPLTCFGMVACGERPSQRPSARLRMLPSPFARFLAIIIAP